MKIYLRKCKNNACEKTIILLLLVLSSKQSPWSGLELEKTPGRSSEQDKAALKYTNQVNNMRTNLDRRDEDRFDAWKDSKIIEINEAFAYLDRDIVKSIMFAALYEETYALNLVYDHKLDDTHVHCMLDTDYCTDHFYNELDQQSAELQEMYMEDHEFLKAE